MIPPPPPLPGFECLDIILSAPACIPGYGQGITEDRGGMIKGPNRIDLYFDAHHDALAWGRIKVTIKYSRQ